jgi:tRNA threonylcarbamoyladenosine biosynthesis protein TsaE
MTLSDSPEAAATVIQTSGPAGSRELGRRVGAAAAAGHIIALCGDLGAGKTTLTQGIAAGLGIGARVTSPTFTLVNEYIGARRLRLVHIDVYRLGEAPTAAAQEAATFGLDEILATAALPDAEADGSVVVIEWAERVAALLPDDRLTLAMEQDPADPARRSIRLTAGGPASRCLLAAVADGW